MMAINTLELSPLDQKFPLSLINAVRELSNSSTPSTSSKRGSYKNKKNKSPYLHNENVQMLSRVTEKRFVQKKNEMFSSFPLAANIYKASSAEFKAIKKSKKGKKAACAPHTPALKACTVSDMSNSEYFDHKCSEKENVKKRMPNQIRKYQQKPKAFKIFDRDARFELNCSSSELIGKKQGGRKRAQKHGEYEDFAAQDVWAVLRNINQFQFNRIQQLSDESLHSSRKKRKAYKPSKLTWAEPQVAKRTYRNVSKGGRLIETVRTEEMTYVANIEIEEKAASKDSMSASSSFDRVTVINKSDNPEAKQPSIKTVPRIKHKNMQIARLLSPKEKMNRRIAPKPKDQTTERPISATSAKQKLIASPRSRFQRDNQIKAITNAPQRPMNTRDRLQNHINFRVPTEVKTDKVTASNRKSPEALSLSISQDSSNCLREKDSRCTMETKLFQPNAMRDLDKRGTLYNANQNQNPVSMQMGRKTKQKMTVTDIKKKLNQIRFPFTILNKDELTSTMIEVTDMDPPQYYGLDKQIWPFMMAWEKNNANLENKYTNNVERVMINSYMQKDDSIKDRLGDVTRKRTEKVEADKDELPSLLAAAQKKPKVKRPFRDKMMTIWQKNAPPLTEGLDVERAEKKSKKLDINIQQMLRVTEPNPEISKKADSIEILHKGPIKTLERSRLPIAVVKHSWAKARDTSEFIENIINKLKSGVYYSQEKIRSSSGNFEYSMNIAAGDKLDLKHASMQTLTLEDVASISCKSEDLLSPDCNVSDSESCVTIPGFDETLPELEIQSLGFNKITVKHCLTNVTLQFDVAVPSSVTSRCASSCCVPLTGENNQSRVYKCSTTIWNAALPAELCTVLPSLMKSMFDLSSSLSDISEDNVINFTNSDILINETGLNNKLRKNYNPSCPQNLMLLPGPEQIPKTLHRYRPVPWFVSNVIPVCLPFIVSPQLIEIMKGQYSRRGRRLRKKNIIENKFKLLRNGKLTLKEIVQRFLNRNDKFSLIQMDQARLLVRGLMYIAVDPRQFIMPKPNSVFIDEPHLRETKVESSAPPCTALQVYQPTQEDIIVSNYALYDFRNLIKDIWSYSRFNIHFTLPRYLDPTQLLGNKCNILTLTTNVKIGKQRSILMLKTSMPSSDYRKDLLKITNNAYTSIGQELTPWNSGYNFQEKIWVERVSKVKEQIKIFNEKAKALLTGSRDPPAPQQTIFITKKVPKIQVCTATGKVSNKCKSSEGKTYLNTIENMDNFIEALGSAKHLASVFDGISETKLMICVEEMKNWVDFITSRQAFLVLLLMCKKDTSNLRCLRSLVLQGIATNRITRATELELEIEVLQKEKFSATQFDGPVIQVPQKESNANPKDVLEELCWIAKTTASDYQRQFNDDSEQFLNTLLQKRKNLNIAYLRVMARYVGLGLLNQTGD